jgi:hypothetical protein
MTSRERMDIAMRPRARGRTDRVPVMCQLALGHYFLHAAGGPVEIWHDTATFGEALLLLQQRYRFDGILVNLPGRDPEWRRHVRTTGSYGNARVVRWKNGRYTVAPPDDNPHVCLDTTGRPAVVRFVDLDPQDLFYVEAHDAAGVVRLDEFPPWHWDTLKYVRSRAPGVSVHAEVSSPLSQLMELVGCMEAALALATDPGKVTRCLDRLVAGTIQLAVGHRRAGADAVLMSSAYAGAGFISPAHYEQFVLPAERQVIAGLKAVFPDTPVYTHTCGAIGDRLDLMAQTGTDGIDTLDPPPLGTVDLADAKARLGRPPVPLFIKGNVDPVNTIWRATPAACYRDALERIAIAAPGGGYILSTACSVPPHAPPENILQLARAAAEAPATLGALG